jgi:hypothetical protein
MSIASFADNDSDTRGMIAVSLQICGFEVTTTGISTGALELAQAGLIRAFLFDTQWYLVSAVGLDPI